MSPAPIRFLFDFISPNAYLAWESIDALAERQGRAVEPVPVLFAGLLNAHGSIGPAEVRAKWSWMLRDILRKSRALGVPIEPPASHPFNPLLALRVATVPVATEINRALIDGLFRAAWVGGMDVTDRDVVAAIAADVGLDGQDVLTRAADESTKRLLRQRTEDAAAAGVFGVPSMLVDGELFWGFDDFGPLERFLAGDEPAVDPDRLARWENVIPSADRRG